MEQPPWKWKAKKTPPATKVESKSWQERTATVKRRREVDRRRWAVIPKGPPRVREVPEARRDTPVWQTRPRQRARQAECEKGRLRCLSIPHWERSSVSTSNPTFFVLLRGSDREKAQRFNRAGVRAIPNRATILEVFEAFETPCDHSFRCRRLPRMCACATLTRRSANGRSEGELLVGTTVAARRNLMRMRWRCGESRSRRSRGHPPWLDRDPPAQSLKQLHRRVDLRFADRNTLDVHAERDRFFASVVPKLGEDALAEFERFRERILGEP